MVLTFEWKEEKKFVEVFFYELLQKICERYRKKEKVDTLYSVLFVDVVREGIAIFCKDSGGRGA